MTADVPTTRAISDEAVSRARRALRAIRLEVVPGIADDLTVIVEAAFTALAQSSGRGADHAREAEVWDEGRGAGVSDMAKIVGWAAHGAPKDGRPESTPNPYRADEVTGR